MLAHQDIRREAGDFSKNRAIRVQDMPLARDGILGGKLGTHEDTLLRFWFSTCLG
jgi:hypothetical protein